MSDHRCPSLYQRSDGDIVQCVRWLDHYDPVESMHYDTAAGWWSEADAYVPSLPDLRVTVDGIVQWARMQPYVDERVSSLLATRIREHGIKLDDAGEIVGVPDGMVLVPKELTTSQQNALRFHIDATPRSALWWPSFLTYLEGE